MSDSEIDGVNSTTLENRKLKHQFENEFLTNLVNKYGLQQRSPFDSSRSAIWHDILREFNEGTSNTFDKKTLQKRWTNRFKWSDQSMLGPEHGKTKGFPHDKIVEEILRPNMSTKQMMFYDNDNPWFVENLEEFLYYCCPECDLSRESIFQSRELFLEHALETHPKAKSCLLDSTDNVKEEYDVEIGNEGDNDLNDESLSDIANDDPYDEKESNYDSSALVKCEIEEVDTDQKVSTNKGMPPDNSEGPINVEELSDYKCPKCNKVFNNRPDLKKHIRRVHVKPFKCDRCDMAFGGSFKLKEHVRSVHEGIRNFKCELCEKAFGFQRDELNLHQDINPKSVLWQNCYYGLFKDNHLVIENIFYLVKLG